MSDERSTAVQNLILAHKALTGLLKINKELMPGIPGLAISDYEALNDAPLFAEMTAEKIERALATIGIVQCRACFEFISAYQLTNCPHCNPPSE